MSVTDEQFRGHQAHHVERAGRVEGGCAMFEVRGRTVSEIMPDTAGHQVLHYVHFE